MGEEGVIGKNDKVKLSIDEQIVDMESKGITFEKYSKSDAKKFLRNASAHSNCLINSLTKTDEFSKTKGVMNSLSNAKNIESKTRYHKMSISVIHDFVTLLLVYNDLLSSPNNRHMKEREMKKITEN